MARLDWERAAKEDYIRRHGSIPGWVGLERDDAEARLVRKHVDLRHRLAGVLEIVDEFARLSTFEQRRQYEMHFRRICRGFDAERDRLVGGHASLDEVIDAYEAGTLNLLKGVLASDRPQGERNPPQRLREHGSPEAP